ncbi:exonuclease domain-containing protein [Georgenia sp. Z1491]|uniref:exonuclease domain-containing protein n=1 Tax=Georgenia sp. Z1491 TaxID=3416707 RepID=UPI003CFA5339
MTGWTQDVWLGFDTETTGIDVGNDRVVTAALVVREADGTIGSSRTWLIDPGVEIPEAATAVHGITTAYAREHGAPPEEALEEVAQVVAGALASGAVLVAFNATYDLTILRAELARHGLATLEERLGREVSPVVDPLVVDRKVERFRKGKKTLEAMGEAYGVAANDAAHTADGDVAHTLAVLTALAAKHPKVADLPSADLHRAQATWHAEWAESFEEFLRGKGRADAHVSRAWPVEPTA